MWFDKCAIVVVLAVEISVQCACLQLSLLQIYFTYNCILINNCEVQFQGKFDEVFFSPIQVICNKVSQ